MVESNLRWYRKMPMVNALGRHQWVIPTALHYVMRASYGVFFGVLGLIGCAPNRAALPQDHAEFPTHRIAVLPFESGNPYISGTSMSDCFVVRILQQIPGLQVIERKDLMKILQEQKLTLSGIIRPDKFNKLGMILGVDAVLVGSVETLEVIQSVEGSIAVTVKLVEVSTGRVLWADRQKISHASWSVQEIQEVAASLLDKAAEKMVKKMEKGRVVSRFTPYDPAEAPVFMKEARWVPKEALR
ncbi:MAG: hypothetical protein A3A86_06795 [Elusimicrobia bacterium RIFCSPLOWO2_01_FULL_60_11]|nr:MAG: hypothetical protein A3A86_06795 [Elusimicrobia bacterium RIFCSPLOWO2_01_FULL_60_11]